MNISTYTGGALDGRDFTLIVVNEEGGKFSFSYSKQRSYETFEEAQEACNQMIETGEIKGAIIYQEVARVYPLPAFNKTIH